MLNHFENLLVNNLDALLFVQCQILHDSIVHLDRERSIRLILLLNLSLVKWLHNEQPLQPIDWKQVHHRN